MNVESTKGKDEWKVWFTPTEKETLVEAAENRSHKHKCVILLGTEVGLRAEEYTLIRPCDVYKEDGEYRLTIIGKDTTGEHGEGKRRDAYLPERVERELLELQYEEDLDDEDRYFPVTKDRIRQTVKEVVEEEVPKLDDVPGRTKDYEKISSHDLRRYFAQHLLVRERKNPRVVMAIGGWDSWEAIKPYLNKPTAEVINEEMEDVF